MNKKQKELLQRAKTFRRRTICTNIHKGKLLFADIHDKTLFTGKHFADGDCLRVMRRMNSGMIDLIYLDPPFNSKKKWDAPVGSAAEGAGFKDKWDSADLKEARLGEIAAQYPKLYAVIEAAGLSGGKKDKSYLIYMGERILEMHRVLKNTGSIYLHCDPVMSHSLKLMMDAIFGAKQFRNEIVWYYKDTPGRQKRNFSRKHDIILRYTKSHDYFFDGDAVGVPVKEESLARYKYTRVLGGKEYLGGKATKVPESVWDFPAVKKNSGESTGYPTQKPLTLLKRVILASSKEGDIVLDPFCGCGTACEAAEDLGRRWIGIDASCGAGVVLVAERRNLAYADKVNWRVGDEKLPKRTDGGETALDPVSDKKSKPKPKPLTKKQKDEIKPELYERQSGLCRGCGAHLQIQHFDIDHIKPQSRGGTNNRKNLQLLCGNCNSIKSATKTMEDLWLHLVDTNKGLSGDGAQWLVSRFKSAK